MWNAVHLVVILKAVCLWLAAAKLKASDYRVGFGSGTEHYNAAADNNQLQEAKKKTNPRPAVQVKVTNEVESALRMRTMMMMRMRNRGGELRRWQTNYHFDTQMPLLSGFGLMGPNRVPILDKQQEQKQGHNLAQSPSSVEQQLLRLQPDYKLLYNAEHHTYFHLHTLVLPEEKIRMKTRPGPAKSEQQAPHRRLFQQVVGNTLTAAFGLNVMDSKGQVEVEGQAGQVISEQVNLYDAASLRRSRFSPFNPTRILIHGWLGNANANMYSALLPAYFDLKNGNYNIFTVDWGRGAIADYITASYRVKPVGQVLAKFVDFLHEEAGLRFEDLQLVGFSMGAHVAGLAGKNLQTGRLRMIRALDPALPFFRYAKEKERLTRQDADHVEVLHTSVGSYGFDRPLGHADFYANWGSQQPGCFWHECSHWRAFMLFAESLSRSQDQDTGGFLSLGCPASEWQQLTRFHRCPKDTGIIQTMGGDLANVSADFLAQRQGVYYFQTNDQPPYVLAQNSSSQKGGTQINKQRNG
ncbi:lipoprotein lipase [Drosophila elegans]|uniref:lipoprotein lipase n=1 Tax=Drosophila elegans TaxID=30023 RepID=UPI0007E6FFA0|nr:lipoprotein lipase [Drosophila elegans]